jgi:hypothetical protein
MFGIFGSDDGLEVAAVHAGDFFVATPAHTGQIEEGFIAPVAIAEMVRLGGLAGAPVKVCLALEFVALKNG